MSNTARFASISLCLLLVATAMAAPERSDPATPVIAYMPGGDAAVDGAILDGLRGALAGHDVRLIVGAAARQWSNAAPETVRLALDEGARVLLTPPDRRVAHLMAQVATRTRIQVVSTSAAPTVAATGSTWVVSVYDPSAPEDYTALGARAGRKALDSLR